MGTVEQRLSTMYVKLPEARVLVRRSTEVVCKVVKVEEKSCLLVTVADRHAVRASCGGPFHCLELQS
jgi:hypothetical protein